MSFQLPPAVAWLERDYDDAMRIMDDSWQLDDDVLWFRAEGFYATGRSVHPRPMIDILDDASCAPGHDPTRDDWECHWLDPELTAFSTLGEQRRRDYANLYGVTKFSAHDESWRVARL